MESRWRLLETTRAYVLGKLAASNETDQMAQRHAEYFRDLIATLYQALAKWTWRWSRMSSIFVRKIDNVRAALDRALAPGGDTRLGMLLGGIWCDLANFFSQSSSVKESSGPSITSSPIQPSSQSLECGRMRLEVIDQALRRSARSGECWYDLKLLRIKGEFHLKGMEERVSPKRKIVCFVLSTRPRTREPSVRS